MASKYEGIVRSLSRRISEMQRGDRLPSELELSREFGVSAMTVRRALQILTDAGRVAAVRGQGTFVTRPGVVNRMEMVSFTQAARSAGMVPSAHLLWASTVPCEAEIAETLRIPEGSMVHRFARLRLVDDQPVCIDTHALTASLYPDLLGRDLTRSLHELLTQYYQSFAERLESRIAATLPQSDEAELLEISPGTPCLKVYSRRFLKDGTVEQSATSVYRGDMWELLTEQRF